MIPHGQNVNKSQEPPHTLVVPWKMQIPPLTPTRDHTWQPLPSSHQAQPDSTDAEDMRLEKAFHWPQGTIAILRQAFQSNLDRHTGWTEPSHLPPGAGPTPVQTAARVYKRGVGYRSDSEQPYPEAQSQGQYTIEILGPTSPVTIIRNSFVLIDQKVAGLWRLGSNQSPDLKIRLDTASCHMISVDVDEHSKSLETTAKIVTAWIRFRQNVQLQNQDTSNPPPPPQWVVIGGGILGDLGAFAAGLAGAEVNLVPTTLLAMVDACVGGKTGVNFEPFGKNQVGLFYFPRSVIVWLGWLTTLPDREWQAGTMESLKHALLHGGEQDDLLESTYQAMNAKNLTTLSGLMPKLIKVKSDIVSLDPGEQGLRAVLNFGHTLGHALEARSHRIYRTHKAHGRDFLLHGEAVGIGMIYGLLLSREVAGMTTTECDRLWKILAEAQLHGSLPTLPRLNLLLGVDSLDDPGLWPDLVKLMAGDKKNADSTIHWILLTKQGVPYQHRPNHWTTPVPEEIMLKVWELFKHKTAHTYPSG